MNVDQCDLYNPCDELVSCRNVDGGFVCGPCPAGYEGSSGWSGSGNTGRREQCHDVDECARGVHCPRGRNCVNTPVSTPVLVFQFNFNFITLFERLNKTNDVERTGFIQLRTVRQRVLREEYDRDLSCS